MGCWGLRPGPLEIEFQSLGHWSLSEAYGQQDSRGSRSQGLSGYRFPKKSDAKVLGSWGTSDLSLV